MKRFACFVNLYFCYPVVSNRPFLPSIECLSLGRRTIAKQQWASKDFLGKTIFSVLERALVAIHP